MNKYDYGKTDIRRYKADKQICGKCSEHICQCNSEIPPIVKDKKVEIYQAKLEQIDYSGRLVGLLSLTSPICGAFGTYGILQENTDMNMGGLIVLAFSIGTTVLALMANKSTKKTIDSLVQDYAKNLEDKQ